ncbi:MAG: DUF3667 domain-containing protein [Rhodospirillaceae bacterium]|nr:DUF3667 domain-containing protein [Rhodospirillaceae bacterium]
MKAPQPMTAATLHADTPWTCPTCRQTVTTPFCAMCGEHPLDPREHSLRGVVTLAFQAMSNVDSRLVRSFKTLIARPGRLTEAFMSGRRKPYIGPFQVFLIANVLFFAMQSLSNMKIFSNTLDFRLDGQLWSDWGAALVADRLASSGRTYAAYAPVFDQAVAINAKSMIGLMVLPFALAAPLLFWRKRRPFAAHVAFALHFYAFLLLLFCVPLVITALDTFVGGTGVLSQGADDATSILLLTAGGFYLYAAIGPAYAARGPWRIVQALLLTAAAVWVFLVYRFALLPITLYTT